MYRDQNKCLKKKKTETLPSIPNYSVSSALIVL